MARIDFQRLAVMAMAVVVRASQDAEVEVGLAMSGLISMIPVMTDRFFDPTAGGEALRG